MNVGIVGTRRRDDPESFELVADAFRKVYYRITRGGGNVTIVSGGCKEGGDRFAEILASRYSLSTIIHYPDTSKLDPVLLEKYPPAAYREINYARNTLVARDSQILIACVHPDRKGGTEDTINKFCKFHCNLRRYRAAEMVRSELLILV